MTTYFTSFSDSRIGRGIPAHSKNIVMYAEKKKDM